MSDQLEEIRLDLYSVKEEISDDLVEEDIDKIITKVEKAQAQNRRNSPLNGVNEERHPPVS